MISASQVALTYSGSQPLEVLDSISLEIPTGSYVTFVGPSGCGKSTLLRCLAGLLTPDAGTIRLSGKSPDEARADHGIAFVFQKPVFFDWLTVRDNVLLLADLASVAEAEARAARYLSDFGLGGFSSAYPRELSGGMLSRAALARALVQDSDFLFLDEAFDHLDEALRSLINTYVKGFWSNKQPTVVAVTHSLAEAVWMSDTVYTLSAKPATVTGRVEVPFARPRERALINSPSLQVLVAELRAALEETYRASSIQNAPHT